MSRSANQYASSIWCESATAPGVRFEIARVSFGRRMELARRIREIGRKAEYLDAGSEVREKIEGVVMAAEIERAYLEWGLIGVEGLEIDGTPATPQALIEAGPVELAMEILARIKAECGLTEEERKN
ncbi:MAG TPA: hypothetical protein VKX39_15140 [Bryobacteraceae bacterium]|jgi:hypothetical protein|nr:hypothetical protein [Bryobacteraceae bacterium]